MSDILSYIERARKAQQDNPQPYPVQLELNVGRTQYEIKAHEAIEEAAELGDRFPDKYDYDVIEHINFVCGTEYDYDSVNTSGVVRAILSAYHNANIDAGYDTFATWTGIDIRPIKE